MGAVQIYIDDDDDDDVISSTFNMLNCMHIEYVLFLFVCV